MLTFSAGRFNNRQLASATTAKASLISKKSISVILIPALSQARGIARLGAMVKWSGS